MNPQEIIAQGREEIVNTLNIGHLTQEEQDTIIDKLGTVLMQRVLMKVFGMLPETEKARFEELLAADQHEALQALIQKSIPDSAEVIKAEIKAGVEEHIQRVNEIAANQTAAA